MAATFLVKSVHLFTLVRLTVFGSFLGPHTHISMRTSGSERRNLYRHEKVGKSAGPTTEICIPENYAHAEVKVIVRNAPNIDLFPLNLFVSVKYLGFLKQFCSFGYS